MNKKIILFLVVICIGLFIPKEVFAQKAIYSSYNTNIDYKFFVDEDDNDKGSLKIKLYDKTRLLSFESAYNSNDNSYYFFVNNQDYEFYDNISDDNTYYNIIPWSWYYWDDNKFEPGIREYIPYYSQLSVPMSFEEMKSFLNEKKLHYKWKSSYSNYNSFNYDDGYCYEFSIYTYLPMILEIQDNKSNVLVKKIVFATVNIRCDYFSEPMDNYGRDIFYINVSLINNTTHWNSKNNYIFGNNFLENINFMRKTSLDYSDELWEELNNGPIASSEIYTNNINSVNYKYKNKSVSSDQYNLPEETIDDYANSLPVFNFKKEESKPNSIIPNIVNPKTWTNGVVVLLISIIVIGGSSYVLIKKKS